MGKIVISENQYKNLQKMINEEANNRYERKVEVSVGTPTGNYEYEGMILDEVSSYYNEMRLTYLIEQEHRSWGIKNISLYDIQGYDDFEVTLHLYPKDSNDSDDEITKEVKIPLDWGKLNVDTNQGEGVVTVGNTLNITVHVVDGKLVPEMSIDVYTM
jgi:hypothetical protein